MSTPYLLLLINTIIFAIYLAKTISAIYHKNWDKFPGYALGTFILAFALVTRLYGFQMWHLIGSEPHN